MTSSHTRACYTPPTVVYKHRDRCQSWHCPGFVLALRRDCLPQNTVLFLALFLLLPAPFFAFHLLGASSTAPGTCHLPSTPTISVLAIAMCVGVCVWGSFRNRALLFRCRACAAFLLSSSLSFAWRYYLATFRLVLLPRLPSNSVLFGATLFSLQISSFLGPRLTLLSLMLLLCSPMVMLRMFGSSGA